MCSIAWLHTPGLNSNSWQKCPSLRNKQARDRPVTFLTTFKSEPDTKSPARLATDAIVLQYQNQWCYQYIYGLWTWNLSTKRRSTRAVTHGQRALYARLPSLDDGARRRLQERTQAEFCHTMAPRAEGGSCRCDRVWGLPCSPTWPAWWTCLARWKHGAQFKWSINCFIKLSEIQYSCDNMKKVKVRSSFRNPSQPTSFTNP